MTQFVRDENGVVQMLPDGEATDPISTSLKQQGIYQSPDGTWAIVTGSPGGQLGGAPRIIVEPGKQPPADVLARFPMAPPQEQLGFQQQAAKYRAGEGKAVPFSTAVLAALTSWAGGALAGGAAGGAEAGAGGAFDMGGSAGVFDGAGNPLYTSPAASVAGAGADAAWGVNPQLTPQQLLEQFAAKNGGNMGFTGDVGAGAGASSTGITVPDWFGTPAGAAVGGAAAGAAGAAAAGGGPGGISLGTGAQVAGAGAALAGAGGGVADDPSLTDPSGYSKQVGVNGDPTVPENGWGVDPSNFDPGVLAKLAKALGIDPASLTKMLGSGIAGGMGVLGGAELAKSLSALAAQQKAAEQARYNDEVARQDAVRAEATKRQDAEIAAQTAARTRDQGIIAPSQQRFEGSFQPGFTLSNDPGFMDALNQSSKATLHGLSVNGNPAGSPNAWAQSLSDNYSKMAYPALKDYRATNYNAGFTGPFATGAAAIPPINTTVPMTTAIGDTSGSQAGGPAKAASLVAGSNIFNTLGSTAADIFSPKQTLSWNDLVKAFGNSGTTKAFG